MEKITVLSLTRKCSNAA